MIDAMQIPYTLGYTGIPNNYHMAVIRTKLTRNLGVIFPDLRDEIVDAFTQFIPLSDNWVKVPALSTMAVITSQISGRAFVGLPLSAPSSSSLCPNHLLNEPIGRNPDYRALGTDFTKAVIKTASIIRHFPKFLRPFYAQKTPSTSC